MTFDDLAAMVFKHEAKISVLHETAVELIRNATGEPVEVVVYRLVEACRVKHQELLTQVENVSPGLAARLDKRRPEHLPE